MLTEQIKLNKYTLRSVYLYYYIITFTMLEKKIGNTSMKPIFIIHYKGILKAL